jgi:hypothetical protein
MADTTLDTEAEERNWGQWTVFIVNLVFYLLVVATFWMLCVFLTTSGTPMPAYFGEVVTPRYGISQHTRQSRMR